MRIALHQMNSIDRSIAENTGLFDQVCAEMALTGYNIGAKRIRVRTHNQKITAAARAIAERKTVGDLS